MRRLALLFAFSAAAALPALAFPDPLPDANTTWTFIGCSDTNADLSNKCARALGALYLQGTLASGYETPLPDGRTSCADPRPNGLYCGTEQAGWTDGQCIPSCDDGGSYVVVGQYQGTQACLGPDATACSWFQDQNCQFLNPLGKPVAQVGPLCPPNGTAEGGWCAAAWKAIGLKNTTLSCPKPPPPPPPPPGTVCTAPTGGPDYGGSVWVCLEDHYTPGSWAPVKLTEWKNAACMSFNSKDCIWVDKACCDNLAATGDTTTPYFECGPIHAAAWGDDGYGDPLGWCSRALALFGVTTSTTTLSLPTTTATGGGYYPPNPPGLNQAWVFGGCFPSSVNVQVQCTYATASYSGQIATGQQPSGAWCGYPTVGFWCSYFVDPSQGYYPASADPANAGYRWTFEGCSAFDALTCPSSLDVVLYGPQPDNQPCPEGRKGLWCGS
ncbi:hypothetical protein DFJ74DRAFT_708274 [Hyaloraphidium curvatum]|nr:hypothetical protein DFJ74DRAFT_708274 [Hyaloraphidium curvatum]